MSAAAANRCLCPSCNGVGYPGGRRCNTCGGTGYMALPDVGSSSTGLRGGAYPSTPDDEVTLEGMESEVDLQLTPPERARISAAAEQMEKDNRERARRAAHRERILLGTLSVLGVVIVAVAIVVLVYLFARGLP